MLHRSKLFHIFCLLFLAAFKQETDHSIVQKVSVWGPRDVLPVLRDYHKEFWAGFKQGRQDGIPEAKSLIAQSDGIIAGFNRQQSMGTIMFSWGKLSADIIEYVDLSREESRSVLENRMIHEFPNLVYYNQSKVRVVFQGFNKSYFDGNRMPYLQKIKRDKVVWRDMLLLDYNRLPSHLNYRHFDIRSNAFGVVSLSLNNTFSMLLHFWYDIWRQAGGRWGPLSLENTPDKIMVVDHGY